REGKQNLFRVLKSLRGKRESGNCNHGVASPVPEPVVARDDALSIAALHNELLSGARENLLEIRIVIGRSSPVQFFAAKIRDSRVRWRFRGSDDAETGSRAHVHGNGKRIEEVFLEIESAFLLDFVFEAAIPVAGPLEFTVSVKQIQREKILIRAKN